MQWCCSNNSFHLFILFTYNIRSLLSYLIHRSYMRQGSFLPLLNKILLIFQSIFLFLLFKGFQCFQLSLIAIVSQLFQFFPLNFNFCNLFILFFQMLRIMYLTYVLFQYLSLINREKIIFICAKFHGLLR